MGTYRSSHAIAAPLTPERIRAAVFDLTRYGRRGYRPDQVHALLDRIAAQLADADRQLVMLREENARLKHALRTWPTGLLAKPR